MPKFFDKRFPKKDGDGQTKAKRGEKQSAPPDDAHAMPPQSEIQHGNLGAASSDEMTGAAEPPQPPPPAPEQSTPSADDNRAPQQNTPADAPDAAHDPNPGAFTPEAIRLAEGAVPKPDPLAYAHDDFDPDPEEMLGTDPPFVPISNESVEMTFGNSSDFVRRDLFVNGDSRWPVTMFVIDGMVDSMGIAENVLKPLLQEQAMAESNSIDEMLARMESGLIYSAFVKRRENLNDLANDLITGSVALVFRGCGTALSFEVKGFERRSISEPANENVNKGSRSSFTEVIRTNTSLIRRKLATSDLRFASMTLGRRSQTKVAICYVEGLTNPAMVSEVEKRLNEIDIDGLFATGEIDEYILDSKRSVFPQTYATERPDRFASFLLEGRVGILIDEMPLGLVVPGTLGTMFQASDDFSRHHVDVSITSVLRYVSMLITLLLPAVYIAVTTFNTEMLPTDLALSIVMSKQGVPFPTFAEVLIMLIAFELLVEASLRIPKNVGNTVSIVGALIIGQAAVEAKIISPMLVIITAITIITSFVIPNQDFYSALRPWRFIFVVAGTAFSFVGITTVFLYFMYRLCCLEVFGVPFLEPLVGGSFKDVYTESVLRSKPQKLVKRSNSLKTLDRRRQK